MAGNHLKGWLLVLRDIKEAEMIVLLSLLVCIGGALVYALAANPKVGEMGRIAFGFGLLVFLFGADRVVALLSQ